MVNGWKVTAIIFIVLFVLWSFLFIYVWNISTEMIEQRNECSFIICGNDSTYNYNDYAEICSCYDMYGELTKSKYMGGK